MKLHFVVFSLLFSSDAIAAARAPGTACSDNCKCATRIKHRLAHYDRIFSARTSNLQKATKQYLKLLIAAAVGNGELKRKIIPMLDPATRVITTLEADVKTLGEKQTAAFKIMAAKQAQLQMAANFEKMDLDVTHTLATGGLSSGTNTEAEIGKVVAGCTADDAAEKAEDVTLANEKAEPAIHNKQVHMAIEAHCTQAGGLGDCATLPANTNILKISLQRKAETPYTADAGSAGKRRLGFGTWTFVEKQTGTPKDELNELYKAAHESTPPTSIAELSSYTTDERFKNLVKQLETNGAPLAKIPADPSSQVTKDITSIYGDSDTTFDKKIWQEIGKVTATYIDGETVKTEPLSKIVTINHLSSALAQAFAKAAIPKAVDIQCPEVKTIDKCKTHETEGPCKASGCKFDKDKPDGEKCFPDPDKKTDNKEGKDGQTGSASTCAGKEQGECEKATGCKWDGKECKDSSFLINKKFALSVISAAFVALLVF
uniref:Variant surface glycoprotein 1125.348 n=1 Tax=Trypanosoma brucei TaxID=5691 RepID=A0A1J0R5Q1_9TRYP|nr:variant surface glycoprotein 1125.348 [Trypanosoma brucei]